jgi:hypothetical protein
VRKSNCGINAGHSGLRWVECTPRSLGCAARRAKRRRARENRAASFGITEPGRTQERTASEGGPYTGKNPRPTRDTDAWGTQEQSAWLKPRAYTRKNGTRTARYAERAFVVERECLASQDWRMASRWARTYFLASSKFL